MLQESPNHALRLKRPTVIEYKDKPVVAGDLNDQALPDEDSHKLTWRYFDEVYFRFQNDFKPLVGYQPVINYVIRIYFKLGWLYCQIKIG